MTPNGKIGKEGTVAGLSLTQAQAAAVQETQGPLLILAGPGSGKTRVITQRLVRLLEEGVEPWRLLAITFTNKAAREMAERVERAAPGSRIWISTFHRFCARLLRRYGAAVGLQSNFTILDAGEQRTALRALLRELDFDPLHFPPDKIGALISNAKNDLLTPERYQQRLEGLVGDHLQSVVQRVYPAYQKFLLNANAVDFDDLLMHAAVLLEENPELREQLDSRYRYVMVDEYQDTNAAQYQVVQALCQTHRHLCVTGDPDQSIYGWRGARIENILRFERDYPEAKVIRLEQNFRSTQAILRSADALIVHNRRRKHKALLTDKSGGESVKLLRYADSRAEAEGIAAEIQQLCLEQGFKEQDIAVFYRVNALSREIELAFVRNRVPHQVAAGAAFYDRVEIKDLIAYLRLIENPRDLPAFQRIVNKPLRGIGKTTQDKLLRWAAVAGLPPLDAAHRASEVSGLSKRAVLALKAFAEMMDQFSLANAGAVADLLEQVIERTRYTAAWNVQHDEDDYNRAANVDELVHAAREFDQQQGAETSLQGFLEQTALVSETDKIESSTGRVTMMTLHAAKGLEFPVVFIVGVEDGLIPHERSKRDSGGHEFEEERRLLFVGMTRAEQRLYLTDARVRSMHGRTTVTIPSPFLSELECEQVDRGGAEWDRVPAWEPQRQDGAGQFDDGEPVIDVSRDDVEENDTTRTPPRSAATDRGPQSVPRTADPPPADAAAPRLMTAAALLSGERSPVTLPTGFRIGQSVRHPRYGRGVVKDLSGFGVRKTVTVQFDDRIETFVAGKAPLQPIGG